MGFSIASPNEEKVHDSKSSVQEAVKSGFKTAVLCTAAAAVPTELYLTKILYTLHKEKFPYMPNKLKIFSPGIAGFFITADRTILQSARGNTIGKHDK
ncbi:early nodulin-93-like protein [Carex littledalei]|uniref:Early nodulin-93-like protein n=1 Tax=Carex littledalei TaxID=544730 RepID=A0A833R166_9POAL|nr:early nodulin-93-like protein [Carex littledalei]